MPYGARLAGKIRKSRGGGGGGGEKKQGQGSVNASILIAVAILFSGNPLIWAMLPQTQTSLGIFLSQPVSMNVAHYHPILASQVTYTVDMMSILP